MAEVHLKRPLQKNIDRTQIESETFQFFSQIFHLNDKVPVLVAQH